MTANLSNTTVFFEKNKLNVQVVGSTQQYGDIIILRQKGHTSATKRVASGNYKRLEICRLHHLLAGCRAESVPRWLCQAGPQAVSGVCLYEEGCCHVLQPRTRMSESRDSVFCVSSILANIEMAMSLCPVFHQTLLCQPMSYPVLSFYKPRLKFIAPFLRSFQ